MAQPTTITTIDTRQYTAEEATVANARNRQQRAEDLYRYGRYGFTVVSTIVVPLHDGITIVDTLVRAED